MRPISKHQNAWQYPLNTILGTEAHVRLLRCMLATTQSWSMAELAKQTGITTPGVRIAIHTLEETGIIEFVGTKAKRRIQIRAQHPLTKSLKRLFADERSRFSGLMEELKGIFENLEIPPIAVWLDKETVEDERVLPATLSIGILATAQHVDMLRDIAEPLIANIEHKHAIPLEPRFFTRADLLVQPQEIQKQLSSAIAILGPRPDIFAKIPGNTGKKNGQLTPQERKSRELALGKSVADAIKQDPSLMTKALRKIDDRIKKCSADEKKALQEWKRILQSWSSAQIRRFLVDSRERASRLRKTLPFLDNLT